MHSSGTLHWLLSDHLGGTAHTINGVTETGEVRYRAFGATRFSSGTTPTTYRFTGQREEATLGLYYYNARWYDPALGYFLSPDTLVSEAGNALDYHRYAYVRFNPLKYEDASGHCATLANGQADENDAECWRLARTIANLWNDTDYWRTRFGELDVWNNHIAPSGVNAEFMRDELSGYFKSSEYHDWKVEWDRLHANDPIYDPMNDPILKAYSTYCMQGNHDCVGIMIDGIGFTSAGMCQ